MEPDLIIPLCVEHHQSYDAHRLDILPYLTPQEQVALVAAAGSIETARRRALPSEY